EATQRSLLVPTGTLFKADFRREFELSGKLSRDSRWYDACHCTRGMLDTGLLASDTELLMVHRRGPEHAYKMLLHFRTPADRAAFYLRWATFAAKPA
ncbi:MAG: hypothetical protein Q7V62_01800, partial [Actinomycetota bacterium]|nr:hypothetical protein [Actinomycetota bacterium]